MEWQARKEMTTLLSGVINERRAEQASGTSTVEKTDLLQVSSQTIPYAMAHGCTSYIGMDVAT